MTEQVGGRVGQQFGNYRLLKRLGAGGFTEVYLGEHILLETPAAVKVLLERKDDFEGFLSEVRTIAYLRHPHIVRILEFGVQDDTPFLVMEYAPKGSLRELHCKDIPLPLPTIVSYVNQLADALQYIHNQKLVYHDIKPHNMLLGPDGEVLLSDFGIAVVAHSTRSLNIENQGGTVSYMAPEQLQGNPCPASDQYALGIIVYEWLCGERPFNGTATEIAMQHIVTPPPPLHERISTISPKVEQVVLTALAKDAKDRFATVQAFATALEQASHASTTDTATSQSAISPGVVTVLNQSVVFSEGSIVPDQSMDIVDLPNQTTPPVEMAANLAQSPEAATPPHQSFVADGSQDKLQPPQRSISRRTVLLGLVGLATVAVAGGGIVLLTHTLEPPNPAINSSGTMFGYDLAHTHFNPDEHILSPTNVSRLVPLWSAATGGGIASSPAVANGVVYVGSYDGKLYAFEALTGKPLWSAPTGGPIGLSSPAVANGVVYVGSKDSKLYAFGAGTGKSLWNAPTGDVIASSPAVANGVVYVGSKDSKLYAFEAGTGKSLWNAPTGDVIFSSPAVANGMVYVGSFDSKLYAFEAGTGKSLWSAPTGPIYSSSPAVANGVVYVGSNDKKLYTFEAGTGKPLWNAPTGDGIYSSPAVANGVVYVGSFDSKLYAFEAGTGKVLWSASTGGPIGNSSPAVANGVVYVGSNDSKLYAFHLPGTS